MSLGGHARGAFPLTESQAKNKELIEQAIEIYDTNTWAQVKPTRNFYTVEIPEDSGDNYFDENNPTRAQAEKLYEACEKEGLVYGEVIAGDSLLDNRPVGKKVISYLSKKLGSPKAASEFLSRAGFVGIKYDGRRDGNCFVIFNESDAKITSHTEFYQTPNGTVYGWTDGKKIYLTEAGMNPNTPVHEYTHLWARAMMKKNPKGWNSIKKLLRGTPVWNEVLNDPNYSSIRNDEDAVASEVLSRISGTKNAAKLEKMAQQMIDEAKGSARKLEARGLIQNIKDALNQFWSWVGKELFGIENFESIESITDRVLYDLVNKTDLGNIEGEQMEAEIRKENESPRHFVENVVFNEKFNNPSIGKIEVADVTPETAKRFGYTFEELLTKAANYNVKKDLITIFAHEDVEDSDFVRVDIYHEAIHRVATNHPEVVRIGRLFWEHAEGNEEFEKIKQKIEKKYKESEWHEEMLCEIISPAIVGNFADILKDSLPESYHKDIELILKETGYDKERKYSRISWKNTEKTDGVKSSSEADVRTRQQADIRENGGNPNSEEIGTSESSDIHSRRTDIQNASVSFLVGPQRNDVIERAVNEEAAKLGVTVTYKTREEMPKGLENDKGYYNTKTGEVVICTENAVDIADAIQTILHEAVAHKGLRQLMGDRFDEFINRVYEALDAKTKANVDALAEKHYKGNKAVAMEEYMASLAETEDFAKTSIWNKIKDIFNDIMNSILGRNDMKIGDNELRYILRASYANMVNPRNMETIEGWAKDTKMREEYKINEATPELLSRTGIDPTEIAAESARQVYNNQVNKGWQEFQRQFQDAMQPVRIAIDAIQQETGNMPIEDYENYILMQNQASSRSRVEIDKFGRKYYSPIIKQIEKMIDQILDARHLNKEDKNLRMKVYAEIRQYLIAKHGLERNAYYQKNKKRKLNRYEKKKATDEAQAEYDEKIAFIEMNNNLTDAERELQKREAKDEFDAAMLEIDSREVPDIRDYSGLTALFGMDAKDFRKAEEEAKALVDSFEKSLGRVDDEATGEITQAKAIEALWKKINKATDKTLRHSYESGLLSRQQYNDIKSMFKFYIPLRGFDETTAEDVYAYARFEGNRFNPAVQTAGGRTSLADDPIAIIMNMAESEIAQGNKNRAKQALYNFLLNRSNGKESQNSLMQIESVWYVKTVDDNGGKAPRACPPRLSAVDPRGSKFSDPLSTR